MSYWRLQSLFFAFLLALWLLLALTVHTGLSLHHKSDALRQFREVIARKNQLVQMLPEKNAFPNHPVRTSVLKALIQPWTEELLLSLQDSREAVTKSLKAQPLSTGISVFAAKSGRLLLIHGDSLDTVFGSAWARSFFLGLHMGGNLIEDRLSELFSYAGSREDFLKTAGEFRNLYRSGRYFLRSFAQTDDWQVLLLADLEATSPLVLEDAVLNMFVDSDSRLMIHPKGDVFQWGEIPQWLSRSGKGLSWIEVPPSFLDWMSQFWVFHLTALFLAWLLYRMGGYLLLSTRMEFRLLACGSLLFTILGCLLWVVAQKGLPRVAWFQQEQLSQKVRDRLKGLQEMVLENLARPSSEWLGQPECQLKINLKGYEYTGRCEGLSREILASGARRLTHASKVLPVLESRIYSRLSTSANRSWEKELSSRSNSLRTRIMGQLGADLKPDGSLRQIRLSHDLKMLQVHQTEALELVLQIYDAPLIFSRIFEIPRIRERIHQTGQILLHEDLGCVATAYELSDEWLKPLLSTSAFRSSHFIPVQLDQWEALATIQDFLPAFSLKSVVLISPYSIQSALGFFQELFAVCATFFVLLSLVPAFFCLKILLYEMSELKRILFSLSRRQEPPLTDGILATRFWQKIKASRHEQFHLQSFIHPVHHLLFETDWLRPKAGFYEGETLILEVFFEEEGFRAESIFDAALRYQLTYIPRPDRFCLLLADQKSSRDIARIVQAGVEIWEKEMGVHRVLIYRDSVHLAMEAWGLKGYFTEKPACPALNAGGFFLQEKLCFSVKGLYDFAVSSSPEWMEGKFLKKDGKEGFTTSRESL